VKVERSEGRGRLRFTAEERFRRAAASVGEFQVRLSGREQLFLFISTLGTLVDDLLKTGNVGSARKSGGGVHMQEGCI
jgi:hypothetical protein